MAFRERAGRLIRRLLREIQYRDSENVTLVEGIIGTIAGFYTSAYGMNFIEEHTGIYPLDFNMNDFRARGILDAINRDPNVDLINFIGLIPAIIFLVYNLFNTNIHTVISPCNHLSWKWASYNNMTVECIVKMYYLFFLFFSLFYNGYNKIIFLLLLYFIFLYYFHKDGSSGSIWCLSVNVVVLYFVLQILVVMPYNEITNNK
jgi:hypothetical protein